MSKVAIFGGSFNPVHLGHTGIVERMISRFDLDKVYVIPTFISPLKDNKNMVSAVERLDMCRLAFSDISNVIVSDMEISRGGQSYTVDTLKAIKEMHPSDELYMIVGADSFIQLPLWYKAEEIFTLASILTVCRGDVEYNELLSRADEYKLQYGAKCEVVEEPIALISSTEIRSNINDNRFINSRLNNKVYEYIAGSGLYGYKNK